MSKNIILISASPRKGGNSDLLCDAFMQGAQSAGHTAAKIRLAERNINDCTGCCTCIGKSGQCVQKDDRNDIFKQVIDADVLVLATPVYFHGMNAQMKTFIDRICPVYSRVQNKEVYYIVAAAGGQMPVDRAVKSLQVFTNCLPGIRQKGVIPAPEKFRDATQGACRRDHGQTVYPSVAEAMRILACGTQACSCIIYRKSVDNAEDEILMASPKGKILYNAHGLQAHNEP